MPSADPAAAFEQCVRQIWHLELAHPTPADVDALDVERRRLMSELRRSVGPALQYGTRRFPQLFVEIEKRVKAVVAACRSLQTRSLTYAPEKPEGYGFSGDPPYDFEAARKRAADGWRAKKCCDLVGKVQEAMVDLDNLWLAIEPPPNSQDVQSPAAESPDARPDRPKKEKRAAAPRNLKELKAVQRRVDRALKAGGTRNDAIREYVEEECPELRTDKQIKAKVANLTRYLNRYKGRL